MPIHRDKHMWEEVLEMLNLHACPYYPACTSEMDIAVAEKKLQKADDIKLKIVKELYWIKSIKIITLREKIIKAN